MIAVLEVTWSTIRRAALAFVAVWSVFACAVAEESDRAEETDLEAGLELLRVGEYDSAIERLKKAVESAADQSKQGDEAKVAKTKALRGWAEALAARGRYDQALEVLRRGDFESTPTLLTRAGAIYLETGRLKDAGEALEKAASQTPRSPEACYLLGESYRQRGNLKEARRLYDQSLDAYRLLDPDDAEALDASAFVYWGLTCIALNRYRDAHEIMVSQAEEIDESEPSLLLARGRMFFDKYNFPDAREDYRAATDQNPDFAEALASLAEDYLADFQVGTRRFGLAEKYLQRALEVNPRNMRAHLVRGKIWFYDGDLKAAVDAFLEAISCNPASMESRGLLAASYLVGGRREAFEKAQQEALAINPKAAEFYHAIAQAIEMKFRYPEIVRMCDRALSLDPDYWRAYVTLGINCLRTGEIDRGRQFLNKSWERDRFNPWVFNTRLLLSHMDDSFATFESDRLVFSLPKADAPIMRPYLEPLLNEAWETLSKRYKVEINRPIRIESFSIHKWFSARTVGLEGFAASGACFGKLVTLTTPKALPQNWGAVAWHEFAHVVTIQLTNYRVPRWLTEGISVYEEGYDRPTWTRNFQRQIADAFGSGRLLPMAQLDLGFSKPKFPMQILVSYFQGCLIVDFVARKWGFDAVLKILDGYKNFKGTEAVFEEVLGLGLEEFDRQFNEFVASWVDKNGYSPSFAEEMVDRLELKRDQRPEDPAVLTDLAWAYYSNDNDVDTKLTVDKALSIEPSGDAHAILGMLHLKNKRRKLGREHLDKALEMGTRFAFRAHAILGDMSSKTSPKDAVEHYEAAKKASPIAGAASGGPGNIYYKLAKLYDAAGDAEKSIAQMEALSKFAPEDPECRFRVAKYAMTHGDFKKAAYYLDELMYINPFDVNLHKYAARAAEEIEDYDLLIRETRVLLGFPETNRLKAYLTLAKAYDTKKDLEKAADAARKVLQIDPDNGDAKEILERAK